MSFRSNRLVSCIALSVLLLATPALAGEATEALQQKIDKVIAILSSDAYEDPASNKNEEQKIRQTINSIFDFQEFSLRAVGRPWRSFSDKQKQEFETAFADLMAATYMERIQAYSDEKVGYIEEVKDQYGNVEVRTNIVAKEKNIPVNYRMKEKDGKWIVYDVIVESVSLVMNYRSQFKEILLNGTPDELIQRIQQKVQKNNSN